MNINLGFSEKRIYLIKTYKNNLDSAVLENNLPIAYLYALKLVHQLNHNIDDNEAICRDLNATHEDDLQKIKRRKH